MLNACIVFSVHPSRPCSTRSTYDSSCRIRSNVSCSRTQFKFRLEKRSEKKYFVKLFVFKFIGLTINTQINVAQTTGKKISDKRRIRTHYLTQTEICCFFTYLFYGYLPFRQVVDRRYSIYVPPIYWGKWLAWNTHILKRRTLSTEIPMRIECSRIAS